MGKRLHKYFAVFIALLMVLSLFSPLSAEASKDSTAPKQSNFDESTMLAKAAIAEQVRVQTGQAVLHKDLQDLSGNEEVSVIIHLSEKPVALEQGIAELSGRTLSSKSQVKIQEAVISQQEEVISEMENEKVGFTTGYSYDTVLNGFAATVKADDLEKLLDIDGITLIEPDVTVYASEDMPVSAETSKASHGDINPMMNTSNSFLGIEKLWEKGIEGQGVKVAVLDTGIDAEHPEFEGIYKGGKNFVPHTGTDYARPRADDDASETSPLDRPSHRPEFNSNGSAFYTSHGTHVAGTIAAIGANPYGIKGIAPKVDLYMYRVLGAYGSGSTSGIIAAIEEAVKQEMDVINLSLGGGANSETDGASFALNNAMMAGTIAVSATGNSGPNRGTIGTPSTSRLGIAVGNTTNPETMYNAEVNVSIGDYQLSKQIDLMATTFGQNIASQLSGEYDIVAIPGVGNVSDFDGIDVDGKFALISRGSIAFVDKIANAKAAGAVGVMVHNNAGGTNAPGPANVFLGDAFDFIPTFDMSQTDGESIRAALATGEGKVSFNRFGSVSTLGDEVNSSSSRGPTTPNYDIKPDVTAPGTNIMSTIPMYKADFPDADYSKAYDRKTGTSMATPHIAGIAALVKQANPEWNAFDVKVALSNTAKILDTSKYDVFSQGSGRVDAYAAAFPSALAYSIDEAVLDTSGVIVENLKGTVTFGTQNLKEGDISVTKQILVKDIKGIGGNYHVSVDVTKAFADATITVDKPSFTLNGEELITVTLTASQNTATKLGDEMLGYIYITSTEENPTEKSLSVNQTELNMKKGDEIQLNVVETTTTLPNPHTHISLPFAVDFGGVAPVQIKNMSLSEKDVSFNGDGYKDSSILSFTLTGNVTTNYIEIWDMNNPEGGVYGDGYIGYIHAGNSLAAGSYTLNIAGTYIPWSTGVRTTIPDGLYTVDFTAASATGPLGDFAGPFIVKTTKPSITGTLTDRVVNGKVIDKYIDYNKTLVMYGMDYNINDKLTATYVITENGVAAPAVKFNLNGDGSYSFDLPSLNEASHNVVKVIVTDAAGNKGESVIYDSAALTKDVKTNSTQQEKVNKTTNAKAKSISSSDTLTSKANVVNTEVSKLKQVAPYENGTPVKEEKQPSINEDGPARYNVFESSTVVDVTDQAIYTVANSEIVSVTNTGLVKALKAGTTSITVKHGANEVLVPVTVTEDHKPGKPDKPGKPNKPGKPDKPGKPNKPGKPDKPGKPNKPGKSDKPSNPKPSTPSKTEPIKPTKPTIPSKPSKSR